MPMMYKAGECFHSRVKRDMSVCDAMKKRRDQSYQKQGAITVLFTEMLAKSIRHFAETDHLEALLESKVLQFVAGSLCLSWDLSSSTNHPHTASKAIQCHAIDRYEIEPQKLPIWCLPRQSYRSQGGQRCTRPVSPSGRQGWS